MTSSQRVIIEIIKWACSMGGQALNYVEAKRVITRGNSIRAVQAVDRMTGKRHEFAARAAANCAGPWARELATAFDRNEQGLFTPSLAFNLLIDREPLSSCALAVSSDGGPVYFLYPFHGRTLAGTAHAPWHDSSEQPRPTHHQVGRMLDALNAAASGLEAGHEDVLRVYSGLLPARKAGTNVLATRAVIHDHARHGGPRGIVSVSGVKFTTARSVAKRVLRQLFPKRQERTDATMRRPVQDIRLNLYDPTALFVQEDDVVADAIARVVREEAVMSMDDLLLRRTDWLIDPRDAERVKNRVQNLVPGFQPRTPQDQYGEMQRSRMQTALGGSA